MHRHLRDQVLRLVHTVIFVALVLRDWCNRTLAAGHATAACIARHLRLARVPPKLRPRSLRGKQPRPPRTVAVVLADSCSSIQPLDQLVAILAWCVRRDIRTLLVYHPQGVGLGQLQQLSDSMSISFHGIAVQAGFGGSRITCQHDCKGLADASDGSSPRACVHLLDANDAHWPLVHAVRNTDQQQGDALETALHPAEALHNQVARAAGISAAAEPDIVLVFGKAFTLAGFPPWLLRIGELYHLGQLSDVSDELLQTTLQKYSSVAQRFGT